MPRVSAHGACLLSVISISHITVVRARDDRSDNLAGDDVSPKTITIARSHIYADYDILAFCSIYLRTPDCIPPPPPGPSGHAPPQFTVMTSKDDCKFLLSCLNTSGKVCYLSSPPECVLTLREWTRSTSKS